MKSKTRKFFKVFLSNVLITTGLVPICIVLASLMELFPNLLLWLLFGIFSLIGMSFLISLNEKGEETNKE